MEHLGLKISYHVAGLCAGISYCRRVRDARVKILRELMAQSTVVSPV